MSVPWAKSDTKPVDMVTLREPFTSCFGSVPTVVGKYFFTFCTSSLAFWVLINIFLQFFVHKLLFNYQKDSLLAVRNALEKVSKWPGKVLEFCGN